MTENELCELFIEQARAFGCKIYPEMGSWDIIISWNDKIFVGVQAKLRADIHALKQCVETDNVHYRVLLYGELPEKYKEDYPRLMYELKIIPVDIWNDKVRIHKFYQWMLKPFDLFYYKLHPKVMLYIPPVEFDIKAGIRSPNTISEWKVNVTKLQIMSEQFGGFSIGDAKAVGIHNIPRQFFEFDWNNRYWKVDPDNKPSDKWPHIYKGLMENEKTRL